MKDLNISILYIDIDLLRFQKSNYKTITLFDILILYNVHLRTTRMVFLCYLEDKYHKDSWNQNMEEREGERDSTGNGKRMQDKKFA